MINVQLLGPAGFIIGWFAIVFVLTFWGTDPKKAISYHAAQHKKAYYTYGSLITLSLGMFLVFCIGWLRPEYSLPWLFDVLCTVAILGFIAAAWVPVTGPHKKFHDRVATIASLSMMPILLMLALSPEVSNRARIVSLVSLLTQAVLFASFRKTTRYRLFVQIGYFLAFDVALVVAAFA